MRFGEAGAPKLKAARSARHSRTPSDCCSRRVRSTLGINCELILARGVRGAPNFQLVCGLPSDQTQGRRPGNLQIEAARIVSQSGKGILFLLQCGDCINSRGSDVKEESVPNFMSAGMEEITEEKL